MNVREFSQQDLPTIVTIQSQCPSTAQWSEGDYLRLAAEPGGMILVAESTNLASPTLLGFAAIHRVMDEAELRNMAVAPESRRQGVGRALLDAAAMRLLAARVERIFLEVRASNHTARELYRSVGFTVRSMRKDYYHHPTEDALVMEMQIQTTPSSAP